MNQVLQEYDRTSVWQIIILDKREVQEKYNDFI